MLCSAFQAAYDHSDGPHQRGWSQRLRDIHTLVEQHPTPDRLRSWAEQVPGVYTRAGRLRADSTLAAAQRVHAQRHCAAALLAICQPDLSADTAAVPQAVLCRRIQKYLPGLFTVVAEPIVASPTTAAERAIRPVVVQRKISGGTRSPQGTAPFCTLATRFGTGRARTLEPLVACRQLLLPQPSASA